MNEFPNFNTQEEYDEWLTKYDEHLEKYAVIFSKVREKFLPGTNNTELSDAWLQTLFHVTEIVKDSVNGIQEPEVTPQPE